MARVLMDFTVFPGFNKTADVDFGPGTTHPIRYAIADYLNMVSRYVDDVAGFRSQGPLSFTLDYYFDPVAPGPSGTVSSDGIQAHTLRWRTVRTSVAADDGSIVPDYPACPFADGVGPPREDAEVSRTWSLSATELGVSLSLKNPRTEESGWDTATHIWLPFSIDFTSGQYDESYVCDPSGDHGESPDVIPSNFAGIDYAGAGPTHDLEIPLGDGTTSAFFQDPGGNRKYLVTDLGTNG